MKHFLSEQYFAGELYVPNLRTSEDRGLGVGEMVQAVGESHFLEYMLKYEHEYLLGLMGVEMLSEFYEKSEDDEAWSGLSDQIFHYSGFEFVSPAANYVYFMSMRDMQTQTSPRGEVRGTQDDAIVVSARGKLVKAWNGMVEMTEEIRGFIRKNEDAYGNIKGGRVWERINRFGI